MVNVSQRYDARAMAMDADGEFTEVSVQFLAEGARDEAEALRREMEQKREQSLRKAREERQRQDADGRAAPAAEGTGDENN